MDLEWQQLYASILPFIPAETASDLTVIGTFLVALCAIVARFWPRPAARSKWLFIYLLVNRIAMNSKHASNADDVNRSD
ncbi:hypothetical protein [Asaia prunellae]|uniref:hypothetical protein n=1 Tax=Asaia prunellae TaxID=610245 RepID=UPI0006857473|nr:hypothetical protein [Asaia prunellae]